MNKMGSNSTQCGRQVGMAHSDAASNQDNTNRHVHFMGVLASIAVHLRLAARGKAAAAVGRRLAAAAARLAGWAATTLVAAGIRATVLAAAHAILKVWSAERLAAGRPAAALLDWRGKEVPARGGAVLRWLLAA